VTTTLAPTTLQERVQFAFLQEKEPNILQKNKFSPECGAK